MQGRCFPEEFVGTWKWNRDFCGVLDAGGGFTQFNTRDGSSHPGNWCFVDGRLELSLTGHWTKYITMLSATEGVIAGHGYLGKIKRIEFLDLNAIEACAREVFTYGGHVHDETKENNIAFVKTDYLHDWYAHFKPARLTTLVTGYSDYSIGQSHRRIADDPKIVAWYACNNELVHDKVRPIPIGVRPSTWQNLYELQIAAWDSNIRCNLISARWTDHHGRQVVPALARIRQPLLPYQNYLRELATSFYCVCPEGGGIDTHRTWESLTLGCIPIIVHNPMVEMGMYAGLPVVIVSSWEELRIQEFTEERYQSMWGQFRTEDLNYERFELGLRYPPKTRFLHLATIPSILIGGPKHRYDGSEHYQHRLPRTTDWVAGIFVKSKIHGSAATHRRAVQVALDKYPGQPVLLLEDDAVKTLWYQDAVIFPGDCDILWIGYSNGEFNGQPSPSIHRECESGAYKVSGVCQGAHAVLLVSERGKRVWRDACTEALRTGVHLDLVASLGHGNKCNQYIASVQFFLQPDYPATWNSIDSSRKNECSDEIVG